MHTVFPHPTLVVLWMEMMHEACWPPMAARFEAIKKAGG
jgi:hypothetical protein